MTHSSQRRAFLRRALLVAGQLAVGTAGLAGARSPGKVMTVRGPLRADRMGWTLSHEHVVVDFIGAAGVGPGRYDRRQVFGKALPHLQRAYELGSRTFVDCTPAYLARDPRLLRQLSEATGLHILTNTGYYGAVNDKCLPAHAFTETADQLADRWTREYRKGLDGTGIRPGFIKIGVDEGNLSEIDRKLITAAARTHRRTGLTIAAHTGRAPGAFDQIEVLKREGVSPGAWIWVHAQAEKDGSRHAEAARQGAWVSFDGLGWGPTEEYLGLITPMKEQGLLGRVLISHDAGWYHVGEPDGGLFQPFEKLFTALLPALRQNGFTEAEITQLLVTNPAEAFTIRKRLVNASDQ
ncbi:MAG: phosphotriesterase [Ferruginibacter sp.]|nr:phosphotriesterase [Cytophagales bacterium]